MILIQDPPQLILNGQGFLLGCNFIVSDNFDLLNHSRRPLLPIVLRSSLHLQRLPLHLSTSLQGPDLHSMRIIGGNFSIHPPREWRGNLRAFSFGVFRPDPHPPHPDKGQLQRPQQLVGSLGDYHNAVGAPLGDLILQERLSMANKWPSPPTSNSEMGFQMWIDITVKSSTLTPSVTNWRVLSNVYLDSNHSESPYSIRLVPDRLTDTRLDSRHIS